MCLCVYVMAACTCVFQGSDSISQGVQGVMQAQQADGEVRSAPVPLEESSRSSKSMGSNRARHEARTSTPSTRWVNSANSDWSWRIRPAWMSSRGPDSRGSCSRRWAGVMSRSSTNLGGGAAMLSSKDWVKGSGIVRKGKERRKYVGVNEREIGLLCIGTEG